MPETPQSPHMANTRRVVPGMCRQCSWSDQCEKDSTTATKTRFYPVRPWTSASTDVTPTRKDSATDQYRGRPGFFVFRISPRSDSHAIADDLPTTNSASPRYYTCWTNACTRVPGSFTDPPMAASEVRRTVGDAPHDPHKGEDIGNSRNPRQGARNTESGVSSASQDLTRTFNLSFRSSSSVLLIKEWTERNL